MNIQELSVGDWIKTTDEDFRGSRECTIQNIEKWRNNYVLVVKFKDGSIETLGSDCFEPIPLTPEILEKNGFKLFTEKHFGFIPDIEHPDTWICDIKDTIKKNNVRIWMFKQNHNWCLHCINHSIGSSNNLGKAYITDAHELQHCLRLAKIDKEIVL
jgi:hypothetical protein